MATASERITAILIDKWQIKEEDIIPTAKVCDELGLDSLDKVEFVMELEKEFDISIDDDLVEELHTVKDFTEIVATLSGANRV